jgi:hypothetical protein
MTMDFKDTLPIVFEQQKFTDFTIHLDDGYIKAHKCILAASGIGYFDKIFNNDNKWIESNKDIITIKEISKEKFMYVIKAAYNCQLYNKDKDGFDIDLLEILIEVGDRFVSKKCISYAKLMLLNVSDNKMFNPFYKDILTIFMKFSPNYDYMLQNSPMCVHNTFEEEDDYTIEYIMYIAKLSENADIKMRAIRHILEPNFNKEDEKYIIELLQFINPLNLSNDDLLLLVKHNFYSGYEVLKYAVYSKSEATCFQNYPPIFGRYMYIGEYCNCQYNLYETTRVNTNNLKKKVNKLKLQNIMQFKLENRNIGIKWICDKKYAIYKDDEFINFDEAIYDVKYVNPDKKEYCLEKNHSYGVFVYFNDN